MMSVSQQNGAQVFYLAESALEITARQLVGNSTLTCNTLTGAAAVTNATVLNGTFTATAVGGGLYSASTTLTAGVTATGNSLALNSASNFAPHGRVRIGNEAIDYASISGNNLVGLNRGVGGTTAAAHSSGNSVSESVCVVNIQAGIPSVASPQYIRTLEMSVEILVNAGDIWAVGARSGNKFTIARYDLPTAGSWNNYSYTDGSNRIDLNAVSPSSDTNAWAVGVVKSSNLTIVNWNGTAWQATPVAGACTGQDLTGVATLSTAEAWAVGKRYRPACANSGNYRYTVMKWNGSSWSLLTPASSPAIPSDAAGNTDLNAISMIDSNGNGAADFGFAVGNTGTVLSYNGSTWAASSSGSVDNLLGVSVVSANEAWIATSAGKILKWNGSSWSQAASTAATFRSISMLDTDGDGFANVGWAVGDTGKIHYYNGSSWSTYATPTGSNLLGVVAASINSAWAVGQGGIILAWNGTSWASTASPVGSNLNGIGSVKGVSSAAGSSVGSWQQSSG
jgi:hypothetical protein